MCMQLYLGLDRKIINILPTDNIMNISVKLVKDTDDLKKNIKKKYIYSISHGGCACDFCFRVKKDMNKDQFKVEEAHKELVYQLFLLINDVVDDSGELYSCWTGYEKDPRKISFDKTIILDKFFYYFNKKKQFAFEEWQYILLKKCSEVKNLKAHSFIKPSLVRLRNVLNSGR